MCESKRDYNVPVLTIVGQHSPTRPAQAEWAEHCVPIEGTVGSPPLLAQQSNYDSSSMKTKD